MRRRCSSAARCGSPWRCLTDGNPSHGYGTATLRGVAQRIFGGPAESAGAEAGGLVDVHRYGPGIEVDLAYRTRDNLTGRPLPGYCENRALLLERPARDLGRVQRHLRRRGLGLLVLDAYRPARASRALVRWAQRSGRPELVGTYIARRSRHNTGTAVDLTLVRLRDGRRLDMGTGYDDLSSRAHTGNARRPPAAQPSHAQAGDGALRLPRLLAGVVALRAPRAVERLSRSAARVRVT